MEVGLHTHVGSNQHVPNRVGGTVCGRICGHRFLVVEILEVAVRHRNRHPCLGVPLQALGVSPGRAAVIRNGHPHRVAVVARALVEGERDGVRRRAHGGIALST